MREGLFQVQQKRGDPELGGNVVMGPLQGGKLSVRPAGHYLCNQPALHTGEELHRYNQWEYLYFLRGLYALLSGEKIHKCKQYGCVFLHHTNMKTDSDIVDCLWAKISKRPELTQLSQQQKNNASNNISSDFNTEDMFSEYV